MHPRTTPRADRSAIDHDVYSGLEQLDRLTSVRVISPAYLNVADYPWLRALLDERERFVGKKRREWTERISEPLPIDPPRTKLTVALRVLDRLSQDQASSPLAPREIRAALFREAAKGEGRARAIAQTSLLLGISSEGIMGALFMDLPAERTLMPLAEPVAPDHLALLCNAEIIASLLYKALRVRIVARGQVRAVVRHAKLMGLLCYAALGDSKDEAVLELSGPYALFRHTRIYGKALSSLVPRLAWCHAYRLEADCVLGGDTNMGRLVLRSGDPIMPARELAPFDSKVEERFARAFAKLARDWDIIREPQAISVGDALIFPDFELKHRASGERWLLEIVGYWTPEYVRRKLMMLRQANIERLILCIDEERCCTDELLAIDARVVRYRRKVDPRAVLRVLELEPAFQQAVSE